MYKIFHFLKVLHSKQYTINTKQNPPSIIFIARFLDIINGSEKYSLTTLNYNLVSNRSS